MQFSFISKSKFPESIKTNEPDEEQCIDPKVIKQNKLLDKLQQYDSTNPKTGARSLSRTTKYDYVPNRERETMLARRQSKWLNKPTDANFGALLMKRELTHQDNQELFKLQVHKQSIPIAVTLDKNSLDIKKQTKNASDYEYATRSVYEQIKAAGDFDTKLKNDFGLNTAKLSKILSRRDKANRQQDPNYDQKQKERGLDQFLNEKKVHVVRSNSGGLTLKQRHELFMNSDGNKNDMRYIERCLTGTVIEELVEKSLSDSLGKKW